MSNVSKKEIVVQDIKKNFQQSHAVIFYNFHWMKNEDIYQLKKELKTAGGKWKVYKNSLAKKAFSDYSLSLQQANAFVFCQADEYKPLNILEKFSKNLSDIKRFQGGIYNQNLVDSTILEKWANLPNKETLINTFCYYLNWHTRRLVNILLTTEEKNHS